MADAVGGEDALLSTRGSSLSVKSAMSAGARPHRALLASGDAHSVISGLVLSGPRPYGWIAALLDAADTLPAGATDRAAVAGRP